MVRVPLQRLLLPALRAHLARGKSILLLGPRQVGKTTLVQQLGAHASWSLLEAKLRQRYERDPDRLVLDVEAVAKKQPHPLIIIDEIQLVPDLMNAVQLLIDRHVAQFILTGSSARKLKHTGRVNLLPGRVVVLYLDPLSFEESQALDISLENRLMFGALPAILQESNPAYQDTDLESYVETYLEEEVRREALVRNLSAFGQFLELAAAQSGEIINLLKLSQEIGVAHSTISAYYQILEDCLIAKRIEPYIQTKTRRRLTQSPKYLFFDLGLRRVAAREGYPYPPTLLGKLFEQWVGLELLKRIHLYEPRAQLYFWRDHSGVEVDWVLKRHEQLIPIEVKWTEHPADADFRHLRVFMEEYGVKKAFIVCRTPVPYTQGEIEVIPWQALKNLWPAQVSS